MVFAAATPWVVGQLVVRSASSMGENLDNTPVGRRACAKVVWQSLGTRGGGNAVRMFPHFIPHCPGKLLSVMFKRKRSNGIVL